MELEREVAALQLRLRSSQQTGAAVSLSPEALSNLKARAQSQEKKVGGLIVMVKNNPLAPTPLPGMGNSNPNLASGQFVGFGT
jgi:hypothetical protein